MEQLRTHQVPHERGGDEDIGDGRADEPDDDDHLELLEMDELAPPVDRDSCAECATCRRKRNMKRNMKRRRRSAHVFCVKERADDGQQEVPAKKPMSAVAHLDPVRRFTR